MTSLEAREERLARARAAIAGVRHDLNNPLAVISGNVQLLLEIARALDFDEDVLEPIQDIDRASRRINDSLAELEVLREHLHAEGGGGSSSGGPASSGSVEAPLPTTP